MLLLECYFPFVFLERSEYYMNKENKIENKLELWDYIIGRETEELLEINADKVLSKLISKKNYIDRKNISNCDELGVNIRVGDICYIDYGEAYIYETGFQHFGLILNIFHNKAFVVPMSGNYNEYIKANSKKHLMRLGKLKGMNKESFLFLNDAKWINTARIIDVKSHLNHKGKLFKEIIDREIKCISR